MRTIAVAAYFWISFIFTYVLLVPIGIFRALGAGRGEKVFVIRVVTAYRRPGGNSGGVHELGYEHRESRRAR